MRVMSFTDGVNVSHMLELLWQTDPDRNYMIRRKSNPVMLAKYQGGMRFRQVLNPQSELMPEDVVSISWRENAQILAKKFHGVLYRHTDGQWDLYSVTRELDDDRIISPRMNGQLQLCIQGDEGWPA